MPFFEVSCKSDINIEEAFLTLARKIRAYRESKVSHIFTKIDLERLHRVNTRYNTLLHY